jgi:hypothetical protein
MSPPERQEAIWKSPPVWADPLSVERNPVKQLLVPGSEFSRADSDGDHFIIRNQYGQWSAFEAGHAVPEGRLAAQLPIATRPGDSFRRATWVGPKSRMLPADVLASFTETISFEAPRNGRASLRTPQRGALHAVRRVSTSVRQIFQ